MTKVSIRVFHHGCQRKGRGVMELLLFFVVAVCFWSYIAVETGGRRRGGGDRRRRSSS